MIFPGNAPPVLGPAVSWGGRLFVPLILRTCLTWGGSGVITDTPLALLIEDEGAWSFVPIADGINQDILSDLALSNPAEGGEFPAIL